MGIKAKKSKFLPSSSLPMSPKGAKVCNRPWRWWWCGELTVAAEKADGALKGHVGSIQPRTNLAAGCEWRFYYRAGGGDRERVQNTNCFGRP